MLSTYSLIRYPDITQLDRLATLSVQSLNTKEQNFYVPKEGIKGDKF